MSPEFLIRVPLGVVGRARRVDLAFPIRSSWRLCHWLPFFRSYQSSLLFGATAWTQPTCTALRHAGTTQCPPVSDRSHACPALAFFMHQLWCAFNVEWASIQTPGHLVAFLLNLTKPFSTFILAVNFRHRCFLWPLLWVKNAASFFAVSNSSSRLSTKSMLTLAQASSFLMTWLTSLPIANQPTSSTKNRPSAPETLSSTHFCALTCKLRTWLNTLVSPVVCRLPPGVSPSHYPQLPFRLFGLWGNLHTIVWGVHPSPCLSLCGLVSPSLRFGRLSWCPSGEHQLCGPLTRLRVLCWPW